MNPFLHELSLEALESERQSLQEEWDIRPCFSSITESSQLQSYVEIKKQLSHVNYEMACLSEYLGLYDYAARYYWNAFQLTAHLRSECRLGIRDHQALRKFLESEHLESESFKKYQNQLPLQVEPLEYDPNFLLAMQYLAGLGKPMNPRLAVKKLRALMRAGDLDAQCLLGMVYLDGMGVKKNHKKAREALEPLALIHENPVAQYYWGCMWDDGLGVPKNHVEAGCWYEKAVDQVAYPSALNNLAYLTRHGLGRELDLDLAFGLYYFAAEQGLAAGQSNVGLFFQEGIGAERDLERAHYYLKASADQGYSRAKLYLLLFYRHHAMFSSRGASFSPESHPEGAPMVYH